MVCPDHEAVAEIAWIHLFVKYEEWKKGKRSNTSSYETFLAHECTLTASSLEAVRGDILSLEGEWGNILKLKEVWGDILSFETAWGTILNSKVVWGNTLSLETVWGDILSLIVRQRVGRAVGRCLSNVPPSVK